ncbi:FAD-binding oxidoreductase [Rhodococcus sp. BP-241]|uniref:FAD-binding oxidoreductase n=1 Tax=Rhodococcus sp. BP-241 TaxID=2739441 RepID=UPI001C9A77D1|nr:FAD-binding oxidoreductase [Rhodococcus sp. BP-241]MBY6708645.1 FAD-binding oxidoreductase [Rhodococcus sp. BP-241]
MTLHITDFEPISGTPVPDPFVLSESVRDQLVSVVGRENASIDQAERDDYRDPYWFPEDRTYDSSLVVFPQSTEQVQDLVRIANANSVPVWASSQGRNNGYGGPSAQVRGSVLISFRKMNRVLEIDTELAYAVVEPGVRWFDLYEELHARGDELLVSVPDIGWGSVIGNSLDNGVTFMPAGSDFSAQCGMEVVLADGSLLRTGMGAQEDNGSWHTYKRGLGPVLDPLFMQSNYGIVTRMGIWLMKRPEAYSPFYLSIPRDHQLDQAIDIVRELRQEGILRGVPNIQDMLTAGEVHFPEHRGKFPSFVAPTWSDEQLDELADETGIGRWGVRTALWSDPDTLDLHERRIRQAWSAIEGGEVTRLATYTAENWHTLESAGFMDRLSGGIPCRDFIDALPDFVGHVGFSPVVPLRGAEVAGVMRQVRSEVVERTGVNYFCAIFVTNDRSATVVTPVFYVRDDPARVEAALDTATHLLRLLGQQGYCEYRAHLSFMDLAQEQMGFGDHAYRRFAEKIKDAVDPRGILSPGRHGIWPSSYRRR